MIKCINSLIQQNEIEIKKNEKDLTLILISKIITYPNVELMIKKKNMIEKLIKEIEEMKYVNKELKNNYENLKNKIELIEKENQILNIKIELIEKNNQKLNTKIELIEKENNEQLNNNKNIKNEIINKNVETDLQKSNNNNDLINNNELDTKIELIIKKNNEELNNKIKQEKDEFNFKIELIEKKLNESLDKTIEINELNNKVKSILKEDIDNIMNKIQKLEECQFIKDKNNKIQLKKCNLQNINSIQPHKNIINSLSTFPSGNIISVSNDQSIIIYDINLNILQNIQNAHNDWINYVEVIDENNFITCSEDEKIKLWIKKGNKFIFNKIINNAHERGIYKVIYCSNGNIISCSYDNTIKIWKKYYNNYINIKTLTHSDSTSFLSIYNFPDSILLLEDKNILISSGPDGTKFWNLNKDETNYNNIKCYQYIKEVKCYWNKGLCRLDEDRIIIGGDKSLKIISILNKVIIKEINIPFTCYGIILIEDKGIFLIGGKSKDIRIYRNDNYECIQIIQNAHDGYINGFVELKDGSIISYSYDMKIKKWN